MLPSRAYLVLSFEPSYARAVYPCQRENSALSWFTPLSGRATSILTFPISILKDPETSLALGGQNGLPAQDGTAEATCSREGDRPDDSSPSSSIPDDEARDPYDHMHLLRRRPSHDSIELTLICVADKDEIYSLLCSALLQRHLFGIDEPLLGFSFDPEGDCLQLVVGWLVRCSSHPCVRIPSRASQSSHEFHF